MSGPKCYSYSVDWGVASYVAPAEDPAVVAARQEAAALHAAMSRVDTAARRLEQLGNEVAVGRSQYGAAISGLDLQVTRNHADSAAAASEAQRLEALLQEREVLLRREIGTARKSAFASQLAGSGPVEGQGDRLAEAIDTARDRNEPSPAVGQAETAAKHASDCARIYDRVRPDLAPEVLDAVEVKFKVAVEAAGQERAPMLLDALRAAVADANAEAVKQDERLAKLDALAAELDASDLFFAEDAVRLRAVLLDERIGARSIDSLRAEMDACRWAAEQQREAELKERERAVVAGALEDVFKELGYQVEDRFETALADDGTAYVRREGWSDHAVCVRLDKETDQVRFNVVRDDKPQLMSSESVQREVEFCTDRVALEQALGRRGVGLGAEVLTPPGVVEVGVVPLEQTRLPRVSRAAPTQRSRARSK